MTPLPLSDAAIISGESADRNNRKNKLQPQIRYHQRRLSLFLEGLARTSISLPVIEQGKKEFSEHFRVFSAGLSKTTRSRFRLNTSLK